MKTSIIRTFALVFSVIIIVGLLCITLISGLDFNQIVEHFKGNVYGLWVFVSVAAALALILTIFNYFENNQLQEKQKRNLQALVNNQKPDENDTEMMVIYNRMSSLSNQLQELSNQQSADKAEIIETERKRISRELHDSVSQELFAATMILSSVTGDEVSVANMSKDQILAQTNLVQKILHEAQSEMRALLLHLRPIELEGKSLSEGLTGLTDELQAKISAHISVKLSDIKASSNIEDNLFRMAQEILSNTLRHAQASSIQVHLTENQDNIFLTITDDGVGFDSKQDEKSASYGLINIKERALLLGGNVQVISSYNQGTKVEIRIPKNNG